MKFFSAIGISLLLAAFSFIGCSSKQTDKMILKYFGDAEEAKLVKAALDNDKIKVEQLLASGVSVNCKGLDDTNPLTFSVLMGNKKATILLLEKGADPNQQDRTGYSAISSAALNQDPWFLETILKNGGNPNLVSTRIQTTPLFDAVSSRSLENIKRLIKAGANVNAQDCNRTTPIKDAANLNQYQIVYYLLEAGADPTIENNWHKTIIDNLQHPAGFDFNSPLAKDREKVINWLKERKIWQQP